VVDYPGYVINTYQSGKRLMDQVDSPRVGLVFDTYHVQRGSGNLLATYEACKPYVDHVHAANVPNRSNLNHGELNFEFVLGELLDRGYEGTIGLEYSPNTETDAVTQLRESVQLIERADS
jgi:hydroxypyruvate isomerase